MKTNAVIVNPNGKFLRSASFVSGHAKARWEEEYPDAALFTQAEAIVAVKKLLDAGVECRTVLNYGLDSEE